MSTENEHEKSTGHNYDGIEELDNRLPNWWVGLLYASIVFALGYFGYYVMGDGPSLFVQYEREQAAAEYAAYLRGDQKKEATEPELLAISKDLGRRKQGKEIYGAKCVACHGDRGQGGIGPNLTDEYWLHGANLVELARVVTKGVADKGMPPWGPLLKDSEVQSVVAYVRSLQGSRPAGAKAPQGARSVLKEL